MAGLQDDLCTLDMRRMVFEGGRSRRRGCLLLPDGMEDETSIRASLAKQVAESKDASLAGSIKR